MGLIIGPRGNTQKALQKSTNTKIAIRGKVPSTSLDVGPSPDADADADADVETGCCQVSCWIWSHGGATVWWQGSRKEGREQPPDPSDDDDLHVLITVSAASLKCFHM